MTLLTSGWKSPKWNDTSVIILQFHQWYLKQNKNGRTILAEIIMWANEADKASEKDQGGPNLEWTSAMITFISDILKTITTGPFLAELILQS